MTSCSSSAVIGAINSSSHLVAPARGDLAHLIAREPLAGDEDHARARIMRLALLGDREAIGLGVEHDERRFLALELLERIARVLRDQELEAQPLERWRGEVPEHLAVVRDQNLRHESLQRTTGPRAG
jgi:hypothetical protein